MAARGLYLLLGLLAVCCFPVHAQVYPFTKYTPKDGLTGSHVRNIKQDSYGRLFFMTNNGLSVYDGVRFINYTTEQGLSYPLVNDMLELGPDSFLLATNAQNIDIWSRGKIREWQPADGFRPVINRFYRSLGRTFAVADQGFFEFRDNRFIKIPVKDSKGRELATSFDGIQLLGDYFLLKEYDPNDKSAGLFWWHIPSGETTAWITDVFVYSFALIPHYNALIVATRNSGLQTFDMAAAAKGALKKTSLPSIYSILDQEELYKMITDSAGNLWGLKSNKAVKISPNGNVMNLDNTNGLDVNNIWGIFIDREGILWIRTNGSGVVKLVNNEVQTMDGLFGNKGHDISALHAQPGTDTVYFFKVNDHCLYQWSSSGIPRIVTKLNSTVCRIQQAQGKLYLFDYDGVYKAEPNNKKLFQVRPIFKGRKSPAVNYQAAIVDKHNFIFIPGRSLIVIRPDGKTEETSLPELCDQLVIDNNDCLWAITRTGSLFCYNINRKPGKNVLSLKYDYTKVIPRFSPRSVTIDNNGNVWVGTSNQGLFVFTFKDSMLIGRQHFTMKHGLTDNFIDYLECDGSNNIWAATTAGLDKITKVGGQYQIDGITRRNNIFQGMYFVVPGNNNQTWALSTSGTAIRVNNQPRAKNAQPSILIRRVSTVDTAWDLPASLLRLSHRRNDIAVEIAAPSFIDEKQTRFSYLLEGSNNPHWSHPSAQADLRFINLPPGSYTLRIKAFFSSPFYNTQEKAFTFIIARPWWQTVWSRLSMAAAVLLLTGLTLRFYYKRKMERQRMAYEKQQAVEQERTRIAMEMHDDLGTGLTSIRYMAGMLTANASSDTKDKIHKIDDSAKKLIDAMNDMVWTMKSGNDLLGDVLGYIRKQAIEQLEMAGIQYTFHLPGHIPATRLSNDQKRNLLLIAKEAVHNIIKHSKADKVYMKAEVHENHLQFTISDNGKGFTIPGNHFGNGLKNMQKRAAQLNAHLDVLQNEGTTIIVKMPLLALSGEATLGY